MCRHLMRRGQVSARVALPIAQPLENCNVTRLRTSACELVAQVIAIFAAISETVKAGAAAGAEATCS